MRIRPRNYKLIERQIDSVMGVFTEWNIHQQAIRHPNGHDIKKCEACAHYNDPTPIDHVVESDTWKGELNKRLDALKRML